jgi:glycosyltransferase involved in cell wall biosynthesis
MGQSRVLPVWASGEIASPRPELRVLQVFSVLEVGGAETWLISLLKHFHEKRDELPIKLTMDVLLTGGAKGVFDDEAAELGARLFYLPFNRRQALDFVREFRSILAAGRYDVIHDHQDYIAGLHFLLGLGRLPSVRIAHVHNTLCHRTSYANGPIRRMAQSTGRSLLSRLATHLLGTSTQVLEEYGFNGRRFRKAATGAAHCGFDVSRFRGDRVLAHRQLCRELGWPEASKVLLFVGRLDGAEVEQQGQLLSHKNPQCALAVARGCVSRDPLMRLAMVGAGGIKLGEFKRQVEEWGMSQQICFLGTRHDVPQLMLGADLLLFPSLAEGLGMVVVEAQAAGLRVLSSDTTPREAVVIPGMVESLPPDDVEAWINAALRMVDLEPPNVERCNAAVAASAFAIEHSAARLLGFYRAV